MRPSEVEDILANLQALEERPGLNEAAILVELGRLRALEPGTVEAELGDEEDLEEGALFGLWKNWPRNREARGVDFYRPTTLSELLSNAQFAALKGERIKPLGNTYSCSECSQPVDKGAAFDLSALNAVLPITDARVGVDLRRVVRVEAGIRVIDAARALDLLGLALPNMGGFAKQTLAGVISTGTHGTGLRQSTFSDWVVSVDIVQLDAHGIPTLHRYEPSAGITDPAEFPHADARLHQSDEDFYAVVVAAGMVGLVYSYTLSVLDRYFVRERHEAFTWPDDFARVFAQAKAGVNLSIQINPYATLGRGRHKGMVVYFDRLDKAQVDAIDPGLWDNPPDRAKDQEFLTAVADLLGTEALGKLMQATATLVTKQIDRWFDKQISDATQNGFTSVWYKTYPKTTGDTFRAIYNETSVPIDELEASLAKVLKNAARNKKRYRYLVPMALRFIGPSKHLISMHEGRDSATIEAFMVKGLDRPDEALEAIEKALPNGRPHWGQMHYFPRVKAPQHYPRTWDRWLAVYSRMNERGIYNSPITHLLGISR